MFVNHCKIHTRKLHDLRSEGRRPVEALTRAGGPKLRSIRDFETLRGVARRRSAELGAGSG